MNKRSKMHDIIMILIIIIAALNYAGYIKVDTNLMMLLVTIALYTSSIQKSNQKTQHSQNVEPLDGSTVAFDKEAFVNLNAIVNELVKKDSVTIPGNLIVKGELKVQHPDHAEDDKANFRIMVAKNGVARLGNQHGGEIHFDHDGWKRFYTWEKPGEYTRGIHATEFYTDQILSPGGKIQFNATHGINMRHGNEWVCVKSGVGTEIHRAKLHHLMGVAWGQHDGVWHHSVTGKICTKLNPNHELGWMIENNQWQMYVNGSGIGTYVHMIAKQNLTCNGEFKCEGRSSFKMRDNVYSHINEGGVCKIRSDLHLDGHAGSGRTVHCHTLYTYLADIDTLRGHAWGINAVRVEKNLRFQNDSGKFIGLSGYEDANHERSKNIGHNASDFLWVNFHDISKIGDSRWRTGWHKHHGGIEN